MDRDRERDMRSRSHRYEDGEVKMYGAGESWRPFNRDRSPRRDRDRDRDRDRPPTLPRSPRPLRSPLATSDSYVPNRSPRRRSRSTDRYRRDRSRGDPRNRSRDRGDWRRRERTRSPPRRFSPRRTPMHRRGSRSPPKEGDRLDLRGRPPQRRDWGRDREPREWDHRERERLPLRDRERENDRDTPSYPADRDRDRDWERSRPRNHDREDPRFDDALPTAPGSAPRNRRSRSPPKMADRPPIRNRSPHPMMSPTGPFRGRSRSPFGRGGRITATYRPRTPRDIKATGNVNGFNPIGRSPSQPRSSGSTRSRRSSRERPLRSPVVSTQVPNPTSRDRTPQHQAVAPRGIPNENPPHDIPMRSPPRGPSSFRTSINGPPSRATAPRDMSPHRQNSLAGRDSGPTNPPVGPRGYVPPVRGNYGPRGPRPSWGPGGGRHSISGASGGSSGGGMMNPPSSNGIPTGPRGSSLSGPSGPSNGLRQLNGPKVSVVQMQLSSLTSLVPGGKLDVGRLSVDVYGVTREHEAAMRKLKEEEEKMREELRVKQERLRKNMLVWEKMRREVKACGIRTDEAERSLEKLADGESSGIAF